MENKQTTISINECQINSVDYHGSYFTPTDVAI